MTGFVLLVPLFSLLYLDVVDVFTVAVLGFDAAFLDVVAVKVVVFTAVFP